MHEQHRVITPGCSYCRKDFGTVEQFKRHITEDVLPPLLDTPELARWCDAADACVLVARYQRTPMPALERAAHLLRGGGTTGVIMTADGGIPEWIRRRM